MGKRRSPSFYMGRRMKTKQKRSKRVKLFEQQRGRCGICGEEMPLEQSTFDHIIPASCGGGNSIDNLRLAHKGCNFKRGCGEEVA